MGCVTYTALGSGLLFCDYGILGLVLKRRTSRTSCFDGGNLEIWGLHTIFEARGKL